MNFLYLEVRIFGFLFSTKIITWHLNNSFSKIPRKNFTKIRNRFRISSDCSDFIPTDFLQNIFQFIYHWFSLELFQIILHWFSSVQIIHYFFNSSRFGSSDFRIFIFNKNHHWFSREHLNNSFFNIPRENSTPHRYIGLIVGN